MGGSSDGLVDMGGIDVVGMFCGIVGGNAGARLASIGEDVVDPSSQGLDGAELGVGGAVVDALAPFSILLIVNCEGCFIS